MTSLPNLDSLNDAQRAGLACVYCTQPGPDETMRPIMTPGNPVSTMVFAHKPLGWSASYGWICTTADLLHALTDNEVVFPVELDAVDADKVAEQYRTQFAVSQGEEETR